MSFHLNSQDIRVEDGHLLVGQLQNDDGDYVDAFIDLNEIIGNDEGEFQWGGGNFSDSADEISFDFEGDDDPQPVLRANLAKSDGESSSADINLAEHISNSNGSFILT